MFYVVVVVLNFALNALTADGMLLQFSCAQVQLNQEERLLFRGEHARAHHGEDHLFV